MDPEAVNKRMRRLWPEYKVYFRENFSFLGCRKGWRHIFSEVLKPWLKASAWEPLFEKIYEAFAQPENFRLAPGTWMALDYIRTKGLALAILSNWDERLLRLLSSFGLRRYFDRIFLACEIGVGKPDPEVYHLACISLGVAPEEVLMVGNDVEDDYQGALRAGLKARLYRGENLFKLFQQELEGA